MINLNCSPLLILTQILNLYPLNYFASDLCFCISRASRASIENIGI